MANDFPKGLVNIAVAVDGSVHDKATLNSTKKKECGFVRKPEERTWKQGMVAKILVRWWYCMDEWPPKDYDYNHILKKHGYREVPIARWEEEEEKDCGLRKVYQLIQFPGIFRDSKHTHLDFRPREGCPSYNNLITKDENELKQMFVTALTNQIKQLKTSDAPDETLMLKLEDMLKNATYALNTYGTETPDTNADDQPLLSLKRQCETSPADEKRSRPNSDSEDEEDDAPLLRQSTDDDTPRLTKSSPKREDDSDKDSDGDDTPHPNKRSPKREDESDDDPVRSPQKEIAMREDDDSDDDIPLNSVPKDDSNSPRQNKADKEDEMEDKMEDDDDSEDAPLI